MEQTGPIRISCWICGEVATTREHAAKRTLSKRAMAPGILHYKHTADQQNIMINGLDDPNLRFDKTLCAECNNVTTQPMDTAIDDFHTTVIAEAQAKPRSRRLVYLGWPSDHTKNTLMHLYWAKWLGCLIEDTAGLKEIFPRALFANAVIAKQPCLGLYLMFCHDGDIAAHPFVIALSDGELRQSSTGSSFQITLNFRGFITKVLFTTELDHEAQTNPMWWSPDKSARIPVAILHR